MPAIFPQYDVKNTKINEKGITEIRERKTMLDRAWRYYFGQQDPSLEVGLGGVDYNVTINVSAQAIDKMVSFFVPRAPKIIITGGIDREKQGDRLVELRTPQQILLDTFWDTNNLDNFILDIALSGFVTGHTFLRLILPETINDTPGLGIIDPRNIITYWDATKTDRRLFYRLMWDIDNVGNSKRIQDIVPIWLLEHTLGQPVVENLDSGWVVFDYERGVENKLNLITFDIWPHPFPPVIDWKNSQAPYIYYGQSDLKHSQLNDALNFVASNTNKIIYHHAGPQTVITGATIPDDMTSAPDQILEIPDKEAQVYNLEMESDLTASMGMMDMLRASFFAQARVVDLATVKDKLARVTNFGVRMIYSDMLDMIANKRLFYGNGLSEVSRNALILMGENDENIDNIVVEFEDPLPTDRLETIQSLQIEQDVGILSRQTVAKEMGRDVDLELDNLDEEQNIPVLEEEDDDTATTGIVPGFN
jgi:hypothetical protein